MSLDKAFRDVHSALVPRRGDDTFTELAQRTPRVDLSGEDDDVLIARAAERIATRLTIAVEAGMILAELMDRGWTAVDLQKETNFHRRGIGRWADPFRRETG